MMIPPSTIHDPSSSIIHREQSPLPPPCTPTQPPRQPGFETHGQWQQRAGFLALRNSTAKQRDTLLSSATHNTIPILPGRSLSKRLDESTVGQGQVEKPGNDAAAFRVCAARRPRFSRSPANSLLSSAPLLHRVPANDRQSWSRFGPRGVTLDYPPSHPPPLTPRRARRARRPLHAAVVWRSSVRKCLAFRVGLGDGGLESTRFAVYVRRQILSRSVGDAALRKLSLKHPHNRRGYSATTLVKKPLARLPIAGHTDHGLVDGRNTAKSTRSHG